MKLKPKARLFGGVATYRGWNIGYSYVFRTHYAHNRADFDDFIFGSLRRLKVAIKARNIAKPELDPINDPKSKYYRANPFDVNVATGIGLDNIAGVLGFPPNQIDLIIDSVADDVAAAVGVPARMLRHER